MCSPIRVAQVVGYMNGGGVEQVVMNYHRHLDRTRVQFDYLVCEGSTRIPKCEIESLGGRVFMVPSYKRLYAYMREIERLCNCEHWTIMHSHMNTLSVFPLYAAKHAGVPVRIAHSHNMWGEGEKIKNIIKAVLRPLSTLYPTYRMACTQAAGEWLFGRESKFEIVYNAIDLPRFTFNKIIREKTRAELGLNDNQLVILHVGRFMPQKNQGFLIDVFTEIISRRVDAVLLLVGEGEQKDFIEKKVVNNEISDYVRFLGRREDVERLYMAADAFCLPSLYEGLGMVAIEAQQSGLPCYVSDTTPHEVDISQKVHFLPIDDSVVWVNELCSLKIGGRIYVSEKNFKNYDIQFAAAKLANRYDSLFDEASA